LEHIVSAILMDSTQMSEREQLRLHSTVWVDEDQSSVDLIGSEEAEEAVAGKAAGGSPPFIAANLELSNGSGFMLGDGTSSSVVF
jgi:hypothetical protein